MSLSELLSFYINKKKTNITQFAQYLEIDRSTPVSYTHLTLPTNSLV
mgnify:CR=1 FL=1